MEYANPAPKGNGAPVGTKVTTASSSLSGSSDSSYINAFTNVGTSSSSDPVPRGQTTNNSTLATSALCTKPPCFNF